MEHGFRDSLALILVIDTQLSKSTYHGYLAEIYLTSDFWTFMEVTKKKYFFLTEFELGDCRPRIC